MQQKYFTTLAFAIGVIALITLASLMGCAPLPPLEDRTVIEEKPSGPVMSDEERAQLIAMHRSFAYEYWKQGNYSTAVIYFDSIRANDIAHQQNIYRSWADCFNNLQIPDSAVLAYEEGIRYFPDDGYLRASLAHMYRNKGRFNDAIVQLMEALRITPDAEDLLSQLIDLYKRTENWDEAIAAAQKLSELFPQNKTYQDDLANLIRTYRDPEEFLATLKDGVGKFPDDIDRRLTYANALLEQGNNQEAAEQYRIFTDAKPDNPRGWRGYAKSLDNLNQTDKAIAAYKKLDVLTPEALDVKIAIGIDYLTQNNFLETRRWAQKALTLNGAYGPAWALMGDLYQKAADQAAGDSPKYGDKLVFTIAYGLYKKAANSSDPQARSDGDRGMRILSGSDLIPNKEDHFMHSKDTRPTGKAYEWIDKSWPEVKYIDEYLKSLD